MYRSRLTRLEEKRNWRRMVLMIAVMVAILGAGVMWGVPFLVRVAMFAGVFGSATKPVDKSDLIPPAPPILTVDYEATNSARLAIQGWTEPGAVVYLTGNLEPFGSVVARDDGGFVFDSVTLNEGSNQFIGVAVDQGGNKSQPSQAVNVWYSTTETKLVIESPGEGQVIRGKEAKVEVKGTTDEDAKLTINDRLVVIGGEGRFSAFVGLSAGDNVLVVVARDKAGNQTRKEVTVNYEP